MKLDHGKYMEGEIEFVSKADEEACVQCWNESIEMTVDEYGRVFNEGGQYVADVVFEESQEIKDWKKEHEKQ